MILALKVQLQTISRAQLIEHVFCMCDLRCIGSLSVQGLRRFVESEAIGFDQGDDAWKEEYARLCVEEKADAVVGFNRYQFAAMVNSHASRYFSSDEDLRFIRAEFIVRELGPDVDSLTQEDLQIVVKVQARYRSCSVRWKVRNQILSRRRAARTIQAWWRIHLIIHRSDSATTIQSFARRCFVQIQVRNQQKNATRIQASWRGARTRQDLTRQRELNKANAKKHLRMFKDEAKRMALARVFVQNVKSDMGERLEDISRMQSAWRGGTDKKANKESADERFEQKVAAAVRIQAIMRGERARRVSLLTYSRRLRMTRQAQEEVGTGVFDAICQGNEPAALDLLARRTFKGVNVRDVRGCSALHAAAENGLVSVCERLLADTNFRVATCGDSRGWTALHRAARAGQARACTLLLQSKGFQRVAGARANNGHTALHTAALHGHLDAVRALLDCKIEDQTCFRDVDAQDKWGRTALHCAAEYNHVEICKVIGEHARFWNVDAKNRWGLTASDVAECESKEVIAQLPGPQDVAALLSKGGRSFAGAPALPFASLPRAVSMRGALSPRPGSRRAASPNDADTDRSRDSNPRQESTERERERNPQQRSADVPHPVSPRNAVSTLMALGSPRGRAAQNDRPVSPPKPIAQSR